MMVGRLLSYWEGNFSGAMLNFGRVSHRSPIALAIWGNPSRLLTASRWAQEDDLLLSPGTVGRSFGGNRGKHRRPVEVWDLAVEVLNGVLVEWFRVFFEHFASLRPLFLFSRKFQLPNLNTTSLQWIADLSPTSSLLEWAASYGFLMVSPKTAAGPNRHRWWVNYGSLLFDLISSKCWF